MHDNKLSKPATYQDNDRTRRSKSLDNPLEASTEMQSEPKMVKRKNVLDMEFMYMNLIRDGKADHTVYGNLGAIRGMQGRHDELIELTQKALKLKPNHYVYLNNLGNAKKAVGEIKEAIRYYKEAISIEPEFAEGYNNLGTIFQDQGHFDEAIIAYRKALKFRKNYAEAYDNLGVSLQEKGLLGEAIKAHTEAINIKPDFSDAYYNLGNSLFEKGEKEKSLESYVKALKLNPDHAKAFVGAGNIFYQQGEDIAAIHSYKKAIQLNPNFIEAHNCLGSVLESRCCYVEAQRCFTQASEIDSNDARAASGISSTLMHQGNLKEAIIYAKKAISIDPANTSYYCILSKCERAQGELEASRLTLHKVLQTNPYHLEALYLLSKNILNKADAEKLLESVEKIDIKGLAIRQLKSLEFAKANCLHKLKKYRQASLHLAKANHLKLSYYRSDLSKWKEENQRIFTYSNHFQNTRPEDGSNRIFIVGVPRCGSTLLESILATNIFLRDLGETNALPQAIQEAMERTNNTKHQSLKNLYNEKLTNSESRHAKTIDKNLYNFINARLIALSMPSAKIIHCNRHPLDNILSMLRADLVYGNNYTSDPADAAKFIIMQEKILRQCKKDYPGQIYSLNYDNLVNDPEQSIKQLIAWLGLEWSENYLHPELAARTILTASVVQARQPISNKSVGGWKNYKELLESAAQILLESKLYDNSIFEDVYPMRTIQQFSFR